MIDMEYTKYFNIGTFIISWNHHVRNAVRKENHQVWAVNIVYSKVACASDWYKSIECRTISAIFLSCHKESDNVAHVSKDIWGSIRKSIEYIMRFYSQPRLRRPLCQLRRSGPSRKWLIKILHQTINYNHICRGYDFCIQRYVFSSFFPRAVSILFQTNILYGICISLS